MKLVTGFSLIELMVVIAIVALLSAVAVPSYQDYTRKATITNSVVLIENFTDKIWEEIMRTGDNVTTISQLGYPADVVDPMTTPMPDSVAEYLAPNIVQLTVRSNMGNSGSCNWITGSGYISNLGNDGAMDSGNGYPFIDYASVGVEYNGMLSKFCAFREFDANANAVDDSVIGSCYNIGDPDQFDAYMAEFGARIAQCS